MLLHMQINLIKVIRLHQNTSNKKKEKKKRQILWTEPHPLEKEFENDNKKSLYLDGISFACQIIFYLMNTSV